MFHLILFVRFSHFPPQFCPPPIFIVFTCWLLHQHPIVAIPLILRASSVTAQRVNKNGAPCPPSFFQILLNHTEKLPFTRNGEQRATLVVSATIRGLVERRGIDPIRVAVESQLESLLAGRWIAIVQQALNSKAVVILGNIRSRRFCCSSWRSKGSASSECFEPTADRQPTFYAWLPPHFTVVPLFLTTSSFLSLDGSSGILARTFGNSSACSLEFVRGFCPHPRGSTGQPQPIGHRRSARIRGSYCSSSSFYRYCCRSCGWSTALTRELYEPIYSLSGYGGLRPFPSSPPDQTPVTPLPFCGWHDHLVLYHILHSASPLVLLPTAGDHYHCYQYYYYEPQTVVTQLPIRKIVRHLSGPPELDIGVSQWLSRPYLDSSAQSSFLGNTVNPASLIAWKLRQLQRRRWDDTESNPPPLLPSPLREDPLGVKKGRKTEPVTPSQQTTLDRIGSYLSLFPSKPAEQKGLRQGREKADVIKIKHKGYIRTKEHTITCPLSVMQSKQRSLWM